MSDLAGFLLARITEDEKDIGVARVDDDLPEWWMPDAWTRKRALAECEAKRDIIGLHTVDGWDDFDCPGCLSQLPCATLRALASVYADHPDYDPAWAVT